MKKTLLITAMSMAVCTAAWATDVVNQDDKSYNLKVQTETKYTSNHVIKARGTIYGLCGANHVCSFEIAGSRVVAKNDARVTIRNGKLEAKAK